MGKGAAFFLLGLLALSAVTVWGSDEIDDAEEEVEAEVPSDVLVLDVKNFADAVEKYDFLVVEFYAPWCGHCKKLAPEWEIAATALKSHDPPIILAKVDAAEEENKVLAEEFGIQGFPTIKIFRGKGDFISEYKGPRESDGIISFLKKLSGPASLELTSAEQAKEFLSENENELVVIGVFEALEGEEFSKFSEVAEAQRSDYIFAHVVDVSILPESEVPVTSPSIRLYKNFDDVVTGFTDFEPEAVELFLETESLPLVTLMSKKPEARPALMKFFESTKDKVFFFPSGGDEEEVEEKVVEEESDPALALFTKDAKTYKSKGLIFIVFGKEESGSALQYFGLTVEDLPAYVLQSDKKKYVSKDAKPEELDAWLSDYTEGRLAEHIMSEPIPETNDEPVKVIVANSLKEQVLEAGKDVLLEFYAPWCGHCKKLAPILDEVAIEFQDDADVLIAKFDATVNDVTSDLFDVKGYPTIYFYSATGEAIPYTGGRSKGDIITYINEHRTKGGKVNESEEAVPLETEAEETETFKDEL